MNCLLTALYWAHKKGIKHSGLDMNRIYLPSRPVRWFMSFLHVVMIGYVKSAFSVVVACFSVGWSQQIFFPRRCCTIKKKEKEKKGRRGREGKKNRALSFPACAHSALQFRSSPDLWAAADGPSVSLWPNHGKNICASSLLGNISLPRAFDSNDALCSLIKRNFQCSGGFIRASLKAHLVKLCVIPSYPAHLGEGVGKFSRNIQEDIVLAWNKNRSGWKFELETSRWYRTHLIFFCALGLVGEVLCGNSGKNKTNMGLCGYVVVPWRCLAVLALRVLFLVPAGVPARSGDSYLKDNITVRQGDSAVLK